MFWIIYLLLVGKGAIKNGAARYAYLTLLDTITCTGIGVLLASIWHS